MNNNPVSLSISTSTVVRVLLVLVFFGVVFILKDLILVLLTAVIIALAIEPATSWLQHRKFPRVIAVLLVYLMAALIVAGIFYFVLPKLFQEILISIDSLQKYTQATDSNGNRSTNG